MDVLVVDDDPASLDLLRLVLESAGHTVRTSGTTAEALAVARALPPELLITDLLMGTGNDDGYDLVAQLRADPGLGALPVVAVTGVTRSADLARAREAGADVCLAKPFDVRELLRTLERLL